MWDHVLKVLLAVISGFLTAVFLSEVGFDLNSNIFLWLYVSFLVIVAVLLTKFVFHESKIHRHLKSFKEKPAHSSKQTILPTNLPSFRLFRKV